MWPTISVYSKYVYVYGTYDETTVCRIKLVPYLVRDGCHFSQTPSWHELIFIWGQYNIPARIIHPGRNKPLENVTALPWGFLCDMMWSP